MKETVKTTISATVEAEATATTTVTTTTTVIGKTDVATKQEALLPNDTTFKNLLKALADSPDIMKAAADEAADKADEEKEAKLRKAYGDDYDLVFGKTAKKPRRRPGVAQLREGFTCVASTAVGGNGKCEVYSNGYAVYDNGNRRTVLWVPDCSSVTYYFGKLKDNEKEYLKEQDEISEDEMGGYPWYLAVMIAGENRIEYNMDHPKSVSSMSEFDDAEECVQRACRWIGGSHFDNPEEAYLKKEAAEERRRSLTEKQREVYELYYEQGLSQQEIADQVGISQPAVNFRLEGIAKKLKKEAEE